MDHSGDVRPAPAPAGRAPGAQSLDLGGNTPRVPGNNLPGVRKSWDGAGLAGPALQGQ